MKYTFVENLNKQEYNTFFETLKDAHFLQSWAYGEAKKNSNEGESYYVGLKNKKNEIVAATLLLKIRVPFKQFYFYAPRGFLINYYDQELLENFTFSLKKYLKKNKALYLRVNPNIVYHTLDENANRLEDDLNNDLFNKFIELKYHHLGFNKLFENKLHRFSFRINLHEDNFNIIESRINKSFMKVVKKSYNNDLELVINKNINEFYKLLDSNQQKIGFIKLPISHYQNIINSFQEKKCVKVFNLVIKPKELITKLNIEVEEIKVKEDVDSRNRLDKVTRELIVLKSLKNKEETICSLICVYTKYNAWTLYIANNEIGTLLNAQNRIYYEAIKDAFNNKYQFIDLYGTVGDPHTKIDNYGSLYEFKRKMGGDYIEFIGEFDLVNKKILYKFLPLLNKIYHKIK